MAAFCRIFFGLVLWVLHLVWAFKFWEHSRVDVARCTVVSVLIILCLHDYVCIVYVIYYHLVVKCSVYCLIYVCLDII